LQNEVVISLYVLKLFKLLKVGVKKADRTHVRGQANFLNDFFCLCISYNLHFASIHLLSVKLGYEAHLDIAIDNALDLFVTHIFRLVLKRLALFNFSTKHG
jgi:hypothetical protein